ncbi:MAG: ADP-ribosylglycohydrolase family protein [Chthoniobacteraceae bacterium]
MKTDLSRDSDPGSEKDRFLGALFGLAVGDAVGTTLEFKAPGSFTPITDMVGGGPFNLNPGEWTDDTSMALCLAASLVEQRGFDPRDQMDRYVRWQQKGYMSVRDNCFDIGVTISAALRRYLRDGEPYAGSTDAYTAGNGSLMRLAPVPLYFLRDTEAGIERAADSSRTTHGAPAAVDACRYFAGLLIGAVRGDTKEALLSSRYHPVEKVWPKRALAPDIDAIAAGSFKTKQPPEIRGTGYVVPSLEAALWAFHTTTDFRTGCLAAANLGDDADTTAAIYGQIAGAHYGLSAIPQEWRERLAKRELIADLAEQLYSAAG